ncbi:DUF6318 family protein [Pseudoglutamicibacter cumminsii]|uniref:DUF6318 family protein n=1 Tax=Pseudoglutamicibacter cumminsii TaxID=156979 RepID=UPI00195AFD43|nr:DUF6318 family protein [Pseudoglutamicibacter cumminsii]MBM7796050.1 hypothetical protein [Pseudoglutamicibacter cumminsii]
MPDLRRSTIAAGLTLALAVGLAACGADNDDAPTADTAPPASASPSVTQVADASATPSPVSSVASASESASPSGPYEPATPKHPARNVPVPGPLPEVAKEKSKAGQVAFIEHWLKELNYGWETGSFRDEFWEITSRDCKYCNEINKTFSRMKDHKAWTVGGKIRYEKIKAPNKKLDDGNYYVTFTVHEAERSYFVPGKAEAEQTVAANSTDDGMLVLERVDNRWKIEGFYGVKR